MGAPAFQPDSEDPAVETSQDKKANRDDLPIIDLGDLRAPQGTPKSSQGSWFRKWRKERIRSWRMTDQPLSFQFIGAGGIVGLFTVMSLFLLLTQINRQTQASRWLSESHNQIGLLNTLGRDFYRQQTAFRDFARTGDHRYLALIRERRAFWSDGFQRVQASSRDSNSLLEDLEYIKESYTSWLRYTDRLVSRMLENGKDPQSEELRQEALLFKQTFVLVDQLIDRKNRLLSINDQIEKKAVQNTFALVAGINIALLLIFSIVLAKLYSSIARPISELSRVIRHYRNGDFDARVPVESGSQIGYLGASFNDMAERTSAMVNDLRKLDELKTDFLSTVSHELRTPLTSINGYVKLLVSGETGEISETQKEFLNIIDTNVSRLTQLINDILDVEKIESGRIQLIKEKQDISSILSECFDTFDILAKQKGLSLKYVHPQKEIDVIGDRSRLIQIFMNLISNAIKYTEQGSVTIDLEKKDYAIIVRVIDTGEGLTPEELESLFQKFYRARSALKSSEGGTGLGLVIVRGLVEAHGGNITVTSEKGKGTTFQVSLPAESKEGALPEVAPVTPIRSEQTPEKVIWMIDSRQTDVVRMEAMLQGPENIDLTGFQLKFVSFSGIDRIESNGAYPKPDLVILGMEAEEQEHDQIPKLRQLLSQSVPIMVIGTSIDAVAAFAEGASALLTRPVRKKRFLSTVKNLISAKTWRVLIADANTDVRLLLKRELEHKGYRVDDVARGNLVLRRLEQERYDMALIDLSIPDISGDELVKIIRKGNRYDTLPIYLMSESEEPPTQDEIKEMGADGYIGRPSGISSVVESVSKILEDQKITDQHH